MKTWEQIIITAITALVAVMTACTSSNKPVGNMGLSPVIIEKVYVQGGTFQMGKNLETGSGDDVTPVQNVTLEGFYMSKYEVTQGQYQAVMGSLPSSLNSDIYGKGNNYPVYYVSWYDALEFCNKLSEMEGLTPFYTINKERADPNNASTTDTLKWLVTPNPAANGYRLPTEAQWEYAAKGGNTDEAFTYAGSDDPDAVAWYNSNGGSSTKVTGTKNPNGLGLYDMSGNVFEWCWDWYGSYQDGTVTDPVGASFGSGRVVRGGSWYDTTVGIRSTNRAGSDPSWTLDFIGFRIVRPWK